MYKMIPFRKLVNNTKRIEWNTINERFTITWQEIYTI